MLPEPGVKSSTATLGVPPPKIDEMKICRNCRIENKEQDLLIAPGMMNDSSSTSLFTSSKGKDLKIVLSIVK